MLLGHYTCAAWRGAEQQWLLYDDNKPIKEMKEEMVLAEASKFGYLVAYELEA
jgi:hypothetical protein